LLPHLTYTAQRIAKDERTIASQSLIRQELKDPIFAIYDDSFLEILGPNPDIQLAIEKDWPFAHEAGVFVPSQDAVYITSNRFKPNDAVEQTIKISKVSRQTDNSWRSEEIATDVSMGNGGINLGSEVLFLCPGESRMPWWLGADGAQAAVSHQNAD